jgi:hypothetical protein
MGNGGSPMSNQWLDLLSSTLNLDLNRSFSWIETSTHTITSVTDSRKYFPSTNLSFFHPSSSSFLLFLMGTGDSEFGSVFYFFISV